MNENITHNSKQYGFLQQLALHSKYKKTITKESFGSLGTANNSAKSNKRFRKN